MKNILIQLQILITFLILRISNGIQTNYDESFILPQYTYIEFLRSTVKLLESEYEPGSISAYLYLTKYQSPNDQNAKKILNSSKRELSDTQNFQNNKNLASDQLNLIDKNNNSENDSQYTYDLLMFSDPNNVQFKNYIKAQQNQQWVVEEFSKNICQPCSNCTFPMSPNNNYLQINLTDFSKSQTMCCTQCSINDMIVMNILGTSDSIKFKNFESIPNSPMIIVIDNTPFPYGDTSNLSNLHLSSSYKITITPNEQYFTATLVLCIVFGGILLIGSVIILSMRRQYQQAKAEEVTRNLVNPENKYNKKKQN